jgi:hypothetical protein
MDNVLNFLFYTKCVLCKKLAVGLCSACLHKLSLVNEHVCPVCFNPSVGGRPHISCFTTCVPYSLLCVYDYSDLLKKLFLLCTREFYALKVLTRYACLYAYELGYVYKDHLVVYADVSDRASELADVKLVAKEVANYFKLSVVPYRAGKTCLKGRNVLLVLVCIESREEFLSLVRSLYQSGSSVINCFVLVKKVI